MSRETPTAPSDFPLAYFITMRTYGTWLHGDQRGSVDMRHNAYDSPKVTADTRRVAGMAARMKYPPFVFDRESASLIETAIRDVCAHRKWNLCVVNARTNHVHIVVAAAQQPERIASDFKAWGTRRLRESGFATKDQRVWVEHESTPYLWTERQLAGAIDYVRNWQGGPLQKSWDEVRKQIDTKTEPEA